MIWKHAKIKYVDVVAAVVADATVVISWGENAAGQLCAAWITGEPLPEYGNALSAARYEDDQLMAELRCAVSKGIL